MGVKGVLVLGSVMIIGVLDKGVMVVMIRFGEVGLMLGVIVMIV